MNQPALIEAFDAVLSDLDGVVYAGPHAIPGAVEALAKLEPAGVALAYITNNASRSPAEVAAHLRDLGAPAADDQVVSSAQAGAKLVADRFPAGTRVLITGSAALGREAERLGLEPVLSADDKPDVVLQGFSPTLGWKELAEASYAIQAGAFWVATNTDLSIPQARGIAPGNGTLVAAVQAATGKTPIVAGKPEAVLFHTAAERIQAQRPLVVGDRLDTDILGGNNAGMRTAVVLTGVDTPLSILSARSAERPDYLLADLSGLHQPYPEVSRTEQGYLCGKATAAMVDGQLDITGEEDDLDSWRAACAAWWEEAPNADTPTTPSVLWHKPATADVV